MGCCPTHFAGLLLVLACSVISSSADPSNQTDPTVSSSYEELKSLIDLSDCTILSILHDKLRAPQQIRPVLTDNVQINELLRRIEKRQRHLLCSRTPGRRRRAGTCADTSVGDGFCDVDCNTQEKQWDGGDCCPHTCEAAAKRIKCGTGGYQCIGDRKIPVWFAARTQLCYRWYADGDDGQCGGGAARDLCAGVNSLTAEYRDDTDRRSGGCRMSWGIMAPEGQIPDWFRNVAICFRWFADGDGGQCGDGAPAETCAKLNTFTAEYRDDTDGRMGGCQMSWKLSIPADAEYWAHDISLCYEWYPDGNEGQCGGGVGRKLCALAGQWMQYYRDDTDGRGGGCRMQWGLKL